MSKRGRAFLLKVGSGDPLVFVTVAGLRVTDERAEAGNYRVSATGVFTGSAAEARVRGSALSGVLDDYRLTFETGETMTGRFVVTRLDYAGDYNGKRTYTVALESAGKVVQS